MRKTIPAHPHPGDKVKVIKLDELEPSEMLKLLEKMDAKHTGGAVSSASSSDKCLSDIRKEDEASKYKSTATVTKQDKDDHDDEDWCLSSKSESSDEALSDEDNDDSNFSCSSAEDKPPSTKTIKKKSAENSAKPDKTLSPGRDKKKRIYYCRVCKRNFKEVKPYTRHMHSKHLDEEKGGYPCPHCSQVWRVLTDFNRHLDRVEFKENPEEVEKSNRSKLILGLKICKYCGKEFKSKSGFHYHMKKEEKERAEKDNHSEDKDDNKEKNRKTIVCPLCKSLFKERASLSRHFVTHLENHPYTCKFPGCGKRLTRLHTFKRHVALHVERPHFPCEKCKGTFSTEWGVRQHKKLHHKEDEEEDAEPPDADCSSKSKERHYRRNDSIRSYRVPSISNRKTDNNATATVKTEPEDFHRVEVGSVHFGGNEEFEEDEETAIKVEKTIDQELSDYGDNQEQAPEEDNILERESLHDFYKSILRDPVFKKLEEEDPTAALLIVPLKFQKNSRMRPEKKKKLIKCKEDNCDWVGVYHHFYRKHLKSKHNIEILPEKKRKISETEKSDQEESSSSHSDASDFLKCEECGKSVAPEFLEAHLQIIHNFGKNVELECPICEQTYATRHSLRRHVLTMHDKEDGAHFFGKDYPETVVTRKDVIGYDDDDGDDNQSTILGI